MREVGDLLLDFGYVVVGVFEICVGELRFEPIIMQGPEREEGQGVPICLIATICFVSLCIALYTVPKLPVPSFSSSVYWLAGFVLGRG